jgi:hypothetical protein
MQTDGSAEVLGTYLAEVRQDAPVVVVVHSAAAPSGSE